MDSGSWRQINITFPDWAIAEEVVVAHLAPFLIEAEAQEELAAWFFIRKRPRWRVRYMIRSDSPQAQNHITRHVDDLKTKRHIAGATESIYEPEIHAFGGTSSMDAAHRLFHLDSRHVLGYLADHEHIQSPGHRREMSVLLCTALLRAAGLDWYEQGDVWARVAEHRELTTGVLARRAGQLESSLRRLITVDTTPLIDQAAPLAFAADWAAAFASAGHDLAALASYGHLHRGLREILTHHVVFAWNRLGLSYETQGVLANVAKLVVFGPDPATRVACRRREQLGG
jgi:thiopeptide-type bacteriocin biosynthesis protein